MANKQLNSRIVHKHDTEANWNKATGFIPKQGEIIVYDKDSTYSYERFKIGDGETAVTALPFADAQKANISHTHTKSQITDFPTSLPANGGNADTVDGKHASDFATATGLSDLKALVGDTSVSSQISSAIASKSDTGHTHDDRYYTETEIDNKLSGKSDTSHTHSSYVNQNAFSNVKVGSSTVAADSATDTLTLTAGSNITLTADTTNDGVTIAAKDTTYNPATTSTAGLLSASDKTKLDGIETGANKTTVDSDLSSTSTNPVQNKAVNTAISNLKTLVGDTAVATQINNAVSKKADLDTNGKVPSSQLPSYVDDVLEYNGKSNFPSTGETGKIYVDTATNLTYRWSGSAYVEISPTLALGETSSTAYRGDRGKVAYDHSQTAHAPSNANYYAHPTYTAKSSGLYKVTVDGTGHVSAATAVAKSDITGLGIPAQDTTYSVATTSANGLMSSTDKTNLDNLKTLVGDTSVSTQINNAIANKSDVGHTHNYAGSSSAGGAANSVANSMTVQLNGGTTEGTNKFTFNGSAAKTVNVTPSGIGAAASSHTHNYAGSSSAGGAATSANKLNTDAGSATNPVYFSNGVPVKTTYTLGASVPSGAKFTDTTYSNATTSAAGLMSAADKSNLDNLKTLVGDTAVSTQINNAVSAKSTVKIVRWS